MVSDLKVVAEYDALSVAAKTDLKIKEFFVFPIVGYYYDIEIDPKSVFKKRSDGRSMYWSLNVLFKGDSFKYRESRDKPVINMPVMGNEILVIGKMLASKLRVLMEKYYDHKKIRVRFKRVTLRTSIMEMM